MILPTLAVGLPACAYPSISEIKAPPKVSEAPKVAPAPKPAPVAKTWKCPGCNSNEKTTLSFFQKRGISDRNALASIMGNIKAESNFHPNICEGGARVTYPNCLSGGFGLIQWTTTQRYVGLGKFAIKYGGDPSTIDTQLRYLVNEQQWIGIEPKMKTAGNSVEWYINQSYPWLGWGIHGNRTYFAHKYTQRMVFA